MENFKGQKLYYRLLLINIFVMISNTIKMFAFCVYLLLFLLNVGVFLHGVIITRLPANMRRWPNVGLLLRQSRRRWASGKPTLIQRLMFSVKRIYHAPPPLRSSSAAVIYDILIPISSLFIYYGHE